MTNVGLDITIVNGIVLTPGIVKQLAYFQTNGLLGNKYIEKVEYNNTGLMYEINNMNEALVFIANEILMDESREKEKVSILKAIAATRDSLLSFMLPNDLKINV
jgi:hypothetical protein